LKGKNKNMTERLAKWFKKYFIPHPDNSHQPHFLRNESIPVILAAIFIIELFFLLQTLLVFRKTDFFASILPDTLVFLANDARKTADVPELAMSPLLAKAAELKAEDMAAKGYFSHNSPEGLTPWYWFGQVGYKFAYAGENLAVNFFDTADVNNAWMDSPLHRANILNKYFTEIGIGTAKGIYQDRESVFIVELFGRPEQASSETASSAAGKRNLAVVQKQAGEGGLASVKGSSTVSAKADQNFIAVDKNGGDIVAVSEAAKVKMPAAFQVSPSVKIKEMLSMPRITANYLFGAVFLIIFAALALKVLIKIKIQHPALIANGVFLLAVICFAVLINEYIGIINAGIH